MRAWRRLLRGGLFLAAAFAGGMAGSVLFGPRAPEASMVDQRPGSEIVATFGVGGVMTASGEMWQYRPDKDRWVSLDESFALEGQATSIVPLPIPPDKVRLVETFGFLVAEDETCWLYDLDQRRWRRIGPPPGVEGTERR